jgi:hypothetical protein
MPLPVVWSELSLHYRLKCCLRYPIRALFDVACRTLCAATVTALVIRNELRRKRDSRQR